MANKLNSDLRNMSLEQLYDRLENFRAELFQLKLNSMTSHVKDASQFKKLKKNIARALTIINEKVLNELTK